MSPATYRVMSEFVAVGFFDPFRNADIATILAAEANVPVEDKLEVSQVIGTPQLFLGGLAPHGARVLRELDALGEVPALVAVLRLKCFH